MIGMQVRKKGYAVRPLAVWLCSNATFYICQSLFWSMFVSVFVKLEKRNEFNALILTKKYTGFFPANGEWVVYEF